MIDWNVVINPLLSGGTTNFTASNAVSVIEAINEHETLFFHHESVHESFYSSFVALAGNMLAYSFSLIPKDYLKQATSACEILLEFCVNHIVAYDRLSSQCAITWNNFSSIIQCLCVKQELDRSDIITYTAMIKSAKLPSIVKNKHSQEENKENEPENETKSGRSKRLDSSELFFCLSSDGKQTTSLFHLSNEKGDTEAVLLAANVAVLQQLTLKYELFKSYLGLPYLLRYVNRHRSVMTSHQSNEMKSLMLPTTVNDAVVVKNGLEQLQGNLKLVLDATKLPIVEPFDTTQLTSHSDVVLSCLCASISVIVAITVLEHSEITLESSEMYGTAAQSAAKDGMEVYLNMKELVEKSNQFGGQVSRNFKLIALYYLSQGMRAIDKQLQTSDKKSDAIKIKSRKISDVLVVALSSLFTSELQDLLSDCDSSARLLLHDQSTNPVMTINLLQTNSPTQRFLFLAHYCNIIELLMNSMYKCFEQVYKKKSMKKGLHGEKHVTMSSKVTVKQAPVDSGASEDEDAFGCCDGDLSDEFSSSDNNSVVSESTDPGSLILGLSMVELMKSVEVDFVKDDKKDVSVNPTDLPLLNADSQKFDGSDNDAIKIAPPLVDNSSVFGELSQDVGVLQQCAQIHKVLDEGFLSSGNLTVLKYFRGKFTNHMAEDLSAIICVLDCDSVMDDLDGIALMSFIQNLLTCDKIDYDRRLQISKCLLSKSLVICPYKLQLGPKAMSIQAQTLLQQQQLAKADGINSDEVVDFMHAVVDHFKAGNNTDLAVEVLQLTLFLFHTLTSSGKEDFLKKVANACVGLDKSPPLSVSRVILLLDYLLYDYSDPSDDLLQHVRWNFFSIHGLLKKIESDKAGTRQRYNAMKKYTLFREIKIAPNVAPKSEAKEKNTLPLFSLALAARKATGEKDKGDQLSGSAEKALLTPSLFFDLRSDAPSLTDKEIREPDQIALNLLLEDADQYNIFYQSIIQCLCPGTSSNNLFRANIEKCGSRKKTRPGKDLVSASTMAKYCFQLTWRIIKALPSSERFQKLSPDDVLSTVPDSLVALQLLTSSLVDKADSSNQNSKPSSASAATTEKQNEMISLLVTFTTRFLNRHFLSSKHGATLFELLVTENFVSQLQSVLWTKLGKEIGSLDPAKFQIITEYILPSVLSSLTKHTALTRSLVIQLASKDDPENFSKAQSSESIDALLSCAHIDMARVTKGGVSIPIPESVNKVLNQWAPHKKKFKELRNKNHNEPLDHTIAAFLKALASNDDQILEKDFAASLIFLQEPLHQLCEDLVMWVKDNSSKISTRICDDLVPLLSDVTCVDAYDQLKVCLEKVAGGNGSSKEMNDTLNFYSLKGAYNILVRHVDSKTGLANKSIANEYMSFLEKSLHDASMQRAMHKFFVPADFKDLTLDEANATSKSASKDDHISFKGNVANHSGSIVELLLSNRLLPTPDYSNRLLQFVANLCKTANSSDSDSFARLGPVCSLLCTLDLDPPSMRNWVANFELDMVSCSGESLKEETSSALLTLSHFIVSKKNPGVQRLALSLLDAILPDNVSDDAALHTLQLISPTFVVILATLANAQDGSGHYRLTAYAFWWLGACIKMLGKKDTSEKMHSLTENNVTKVMATCAPLLLYIRDILHAVIKANSESSEAIDADDSDLDDGDVLFEHECEFDDEDAQTAVPIEDDTSQEEDGLWNKLCTYTITQKKFMNQHWYHCHTCDMVDGVGVCTICAKVCHKTHELSYAKFGSFFCDCGAKEDKSCKAMVKRVPGSNKVASGISAFSDSNPASTSASAASTIAPASSSTSNASQKHGGKKSNQQHSPAFAAERLQRLVSKKRKGKRQTVSGSPVVVDGCKEKLLALIASQDTDTLSNLPRSGGVSQILHELLQAMSRIVNSDSYKLNTASGTARALKAMEDLCNHSKSTQLVDTLMVPTLGSQEGAFENVKANFSGEQGQTIRQLINSRVIRRVAMCCLSTTAGRRQHLAVTHEKGKVTLLQLSALLKQADASKRKLTLTRLSTTQMPFAVITITANPCNEEALAVCGLKDCHVLTFASSPQATAPAGSVQQHLVLHPQLAASNYIIRAVWLPAFPTLLALVTGDFIKIYDLSKDVLSPCYYYLLPTGKIRDATFIGGQKGQFDTCLIVMSSTGHLYSQFLHENSLALHGTFYLTNVLAVSHKNLKENGGQVGGGGASVFYSHSLSLLFFSYTNGNNFAASLCSSYDAILNLFSITYKPSNSSNSAARNGSGSLSTLYEWSDVTNHPGMMTCFAQTSSCPVVLMIEPEKILLQEIKATSNKSKIQDLVAVRHSSVIGEDAAERTTVIVLCEDGSLRIYLASSEHTGYWLQPRLRPTVVFDSSKNHKKSLGTTTGKPKDEDEAVGFPIDFFESCQVLSNSDLEFGGDLLEVYNPAQIKNRLNSTGMYLMGKKIFNISITQKNSNMVITGLRVLVGSQGGLKAPTYFYIDERYISLGPRLTRARWFDLPLTRAESLKNHAKIILTCGPSEDPDDYNVIDSLKVYAKTKEAFGWPPDDSAADKKTAAGSAANKAAASSKTCGNGSGNSDVESDASGALADGVEAHPPSGAADEMLYSCLGALNVSLHETFSGLFYPRDKILQTVSRLLVQPLSLDVHSAVKRTLTKLFQAKPSCNKFQDEILLENAVKVLSAENTEVPESRDEAVSSGNLIDEEGFQRILAHLSHIARSRPFNLAINLTESSKDSQMKLIELESNQSIVETVTPCSDNSSHIQLLKKMVSAFWRLLANKPRSKLLTRACLPGLTRIDVTVKAMVDVIHAVSATVDGCLDTASSIYFDLLTCPNPRVSFAARSALIKLLRTKHDAPADSASVIVRSSSKMSETPPSTRSASPPSVTSSNRTGAIGRGFRMSDVASDRPGSHVSSRGTAGGTTDDAEEEDDDEDDDDNDDEDDDNEDDNDDDEFEHLENDVIDDVAMAIEEQLMAGDDTLEFAAPSNPIPNNPDFFQQNMLPSSVTDAAASEYSRLLMGAQSSEAASSSADAEGVRLIGSRSLTMDMMRAMAEEVAREEQGLNDQDQQDIENMLMGVEFPNLLPPDGDDDEAMVEYAIALSLQQQEQQQQESRPAQNRPPVSQSLPIPVPAPPTQDRPRQHSVGGSSSHSEGVDPSPNATPAMLDQSGHLDVSESPHARFDETICVEPSASNSKMNDAEAIGKAKLMELRLAILKNLFSKLEQVEALGGEQCIPFFQVVATLALSLNPSCPQHVDLLREIVITVVQRLNNDTQDDVNVAQQTPAHEVHVIMMRLLSIMMSKSQAQTEGSSKAESVVDGEISDRLAHSNIASLTASILTQEKIVDLCYNVLDVLYKKHWKIQAEQQKHKESTSVNVNLLRHSRNSISVDMSPFFLHQYVQSHAGAIFEPYLRLITEMALNLAYQVRKQFTDGGDLHAAFGRTWRQLLSEYMLFAGVPSLVRRRARKLLLFIAGSKEKYREERDLHALECYIKESSKLCKWSEEEELAGLNLTYDELIQLVELIKKCCEIADSRNKNWQRYCVSNSACLPFLLDASVHADESVAVNALKLLLCAINPSQSTSASEKHRKSSKTSLKSTTSVKDPKPVITKDSKASVAMAKQLSQAIMNSIKDDAMLQFLRHFLLEMNTTSIRWSVHALVHNLFKNSSSVSQEKLVKTMWSLWPHVVTYGRKAAQFVDLLGYLSMKLGLTSNLAKLYTDATFQSLKKQNDLLSNHQNAILYSQLANYVQFDGYYLESNPCLVCNQADFPFTSVKLTSIKGDTKYTTTQQITKLNGSYTIQKLTIKVTDVKRTKMIRTAVLFYNNKKVPAIVDLKNKPSMWHRAKSVIVPQGESEIRFDLPLPVVATNLMIEFVDFYENVSASIETLQCPRCSASVQANPGICSNCGENVFQCHKCRSINYDEKDPYLCNVCGFSKYAKFDVSVVSRPCCAVESIENDEDRKKMVSAVGSLLEKADTVYNQLNAYKPTLETLLLQISQVYSESSVTQEKFSKSSTAATSTSVANKPTSTGKGLQQITLQGGGAIIGATQSSAVSTNIQQLAKKYCQECRALFEELSSIMRTVLASRSEIVDYDRRQLLAITGKTATRGNSRHFSASSSWSQSAPGCYGCASATAQQCITLLRVLANSGNAKPLLVSNNVIDELVSFNLRRTTAKTRKQVHSLIGQLVKNNQYATSQLNNLLLTRIIGAVNHHGDDLASSAVAYEIELLKSMLEVRDDLWQERLKAVVELFQNVVAMRSPAVVENVTLPCTDMLQKMVTCKNPGRPSYGPVSISCEKWLKSEPGHDFDSWQKRKQNVFKADADKVIPKESARSIHLQEKYARKWKEYVSARKYQVPQKLKLAENSFLRQMLFCPSSTSIREVASLLVVSLAQNSARRPLIIDLLTSFLDELGTAGEAASRFILLYHEQIAPKQYRVHLAVKGALPLLGSLIQKEIAKLSELEETTLSLHLQQGFALKELIEILSEIVQVSYVRQHYKSSLVGTVLNSYLSLRRLVIQRTNLVDDAQEMLLELLEELTTGTESETRAFIAVCIEAIKKQNMSDLKTPQFIFERLTNIIYPEETDTSEFFMSLDKDPLQEDFLQGRMVGNPYSSNEPGLGPLMRDVKNKICRDCDLIALLEDDSGMEILVNNKIIALDLPVREVHKKIWLSNHNEDEAMHVVYRMRGLLGEATEDIVERLDSDKTDQDEEEVYKLASGLSECGGIEVMLSRLESVKSLLHARQLVDVILKLLSYAVKLKVNRRYLAQPKLNTLNTLLGTLNLGLQAGEDGVAMVDLLLQIMWSVLEEATACKTSQEKRDDDVFTDDKDKLMLLLQQVDSEFVRGHTNILQGLLRIIPFLSFGDPDLMQMLVDHFISVLNFEKYDESHSDDETIYLNCFCEIVAGIQFNESGNQLKDLIVKNGIVKEALAYINNHIPENRNYDGDDWKAFISRPGLPYCLRMLAGLCKKHQTTQELVGKSAVAGLHRLEQISSEGSIGSHAENVLESLQEHPDIAKQIKQVRRQTREEKKKKAMEMRKQQIGALGMHTNEKGQVISKSTILQQISELVEEAGLTCIICREGYKFEPKKVLGIYTYTRRCPLEEFESKPRKQMGYSTVSHFNVVHYDCHTAAVRMARGREEWDSALLQNASTKCNGLLPLWGAQVPEAAFASCLARHNTYIQEATGQREPGFYSNVHDLKLLLLRFAQEKSFSEETGGGGRQSNINLIPYLIHAGLYVINTTRNQAKHERLITEFFSAPKEKWVEAAYEVEGPLFIAAMLPFFYGSSKWKQERQKVFDRVMILAQARVTSSTSISTLSDRQVKGYFLYKPYLLFYALVDLIITLLFKHAPDDGGSSGLASYIRHNDCQLLDTAEKMLLKFQDEILVCESLAEFVDVMEMHDFVTGDVTDYLKRLFEGLPTQ